MGDVKLKLLPTIMLTVALGVLPTIPASANNLGENQAWQFDTSADKVNKAYLALIDQKFYKGRADGASNARFVQALRDFQQSEKLPVTGLPGIDTFIRAVIKPQQG